MIATWTAPLPSGKTSDELLVAFDEGRERRVLILPAWFDEANKLRRFTIQTMRALDQAGIDSFLPDLPGCNESLAPLDQQTLTSWRTCVDLVATQLNATHILAIRAGALLAPQSLPGWLFAPQNGPKMLRGMIRARTIASREGGKHETSDELMQHGRQNGLTLAGWPLSAQMFGELESADVPENPSQNVISAKDLGGAGLWLRAEPGEDLAQSQALAAIIAADDRTTA